MKRINLGNGSWFNPDSSTIFTESYRWGGQNYISLATESQWDHQDLYRTAKGNWVLREYSDWQGTSERYSVVPDEDAYEWLLKNNYNTSYITYYKSPYSSPVEEYFADSSEV